MQSLHSGLFLTPKHNRPWNPWSNQKTGLSTWPKAQHKPAGGGVSAKLQFRLLHGGAYVTTPLEGCVTQPLPSHILSAARWAQIPLWEAANNFVLLAWVAAGFCLLRYLFLQSIAVTERKPCIKRLVLKYISSRGVHLSSLDFESISYPWLQAVSALGIPATGHWRMKNEMIALKSGWSRSQALIYSIKRQKASGEAISTPRMSKSCACCL